jgi:hypothetical protein
MTPRATKARAVKIPLSKFVADALPAERPPNQDITREALGNTIVKVIGTYQAVEPRLRSIRDREHRVTVAADQVVAAVKVEKLDEALEELADLALYIAVGRQMYLGARRIRDEVERVRNWRRSFAPRKGPALAFSAEFTQEIKRLFDTSGYKKLQLTLFLQRLSEHPGLPTFSLETLKKRPRARKYRAPPPL